MLRLRRRDRPLHERQERFLQNVLSFAVAEAQRPPIKEQFGRFGVIQSFAPPRLLVSIHKFTG